MTTNLQDAIGIAVIILAFFIGCAVYVWAAGKNNNDDNDL